ncbi:unnamed protein product [Mycena citricolor]|nr:unnamed protein product [Mycena citricolor]
MTTALMSYSMVFMRFAWRVQPRNYLLLACHGTNAAAQALQETRFVNYWYYGGREKKLGVSVDQVADKAVGKVTEAVKAVQDAKK